MPNNIASALSACLLFSVPLAFAATALMTLVAGDRPVRSMWRHGLRASNVALGAAATLVPLTLILPAFSTHPGRAVGGMTALLGSAVGVRVDGVTGLVLALIAFLGWVILRFSRTYLQDEANQARYLRWLMATLAAIAMLVVTNNLLVLAAAWIAASLCLHRLLTFFEDRPQAALAAHKKFMVSRAAEACLIAGIYLTASTLHTVDLDRLYSAVGALTTLPWTLQLAALLFAASAALQCAQLPFHGWLIQVMEAPTPVSALLHAGIINIGGFFMIRLMPLMLRATAAQTLLVVVGGLTATIAALIMITQNSVKVSLTWSSCAQMGFMLLECGLGAYSLALLHLLAHSLYKAHAFLSSSSVVSEQRGAAAAARPRKLTPWLMAPVASMAMVVAMARVWGIGLAGHPAMLALSVVLALALPPLIIGRTKAPSWRGTAATAVAACATAALYFCWHTLFDAALTPHVAAMPHAAGLAGFVVAAFALLYVLQVAAEVYPDSRLMRSLLPHFRAGLHIDAAFSSLTLRLWPSSAARGPGREPVLSTLDTRGT